MPVVDGAGKSSSDGTCETPEGAPNIVVDYDAGTIQIVRPRARKRPHSSGPKLSGAIRDVPLRLAKPRRCELAPSHRHRTFLVKSDLDRLCLAEEAMNRAPVQYVDADGLKWTVVERFRRATLVGPGPKPAHADGATPPSYLEFRSRGELRIDRGRLEEWESRLAALFPLAEPTPP